MKIVKCFFYHEIDESKKVDAKPEIHYLAERNDN
jgi:hypothetical protein